MAHIDWKQRLQDVVNQRANVKMEYISLLKRSPTPAQAGAKMFELQRLKLREMRVSDAGEFNKWRIYRDPRLPDMSEDEVALWKQNNQIYTSYDPGPGTPPPAFPGHFGFGSDVPRYKIPKDDPDLKQFLETPISQLGVNWKGTRLLGQGSFGKVTLWEYQGPGGPDQPLIRKCAIKDLAYNSFGDLAEEGDIMYHLMQSLSPHIAELLTPPQPELVDPNWVGRVKRLIIEYCPQGNLSELQHRRRARGDAFLESSLWSMFDCLVDGLCVLEQGAEYQFDPVTDQQVNTRRPNWPDVVHFDLKPANVLLGDRDDDHPVTPVVKISDFGLSMPVPYGGIALNERRAQRPRGTRGYYPPENFTERWDYSDWASTGVAGEWSTKSNIWGIGAIMWFLVTLEFHAPDPGKPFLPDFLLLENPPKGATYGREIEAHYYSDFLKQTIWTCLYEKPADRPSLLELKRGCKEGLRFAKDEEEALGLLNGEDWDAFEAPEPLDQPPDPPVPSPFNRPGTSPGPALAPQQGNQNALQGRFYVPPIPPFRGGP